MKMIGSIKVIRKAPNNCSESELADFQSLVLAGGEVTPTGLGNRVGSAHVLAFLTLGKCLVGVAALKRPEARYRKRVFHKSGTTIAEADYPFELGWVFVLPSARGWHLSSNLVQEVMLSAGTHGVFATSRTDNRPMHATLGKYSFSTVGKPYSSSRGDHQLQLFVHHGAQQAVATAAPKAARR